MPPRRLRTSGAAILVAALGALLAAGCAGPLATAPVPRLTDVPSATLAPNPTPPPPTASPSPTLAPTPTQGPTPIPIYTFSIAGAEYGYLVISAPPGSSCSTTIAFPDNTTQKLAAKTAGKDGKVDWRYPAPTRSDGTAQAVVVCSLNGKSATETIEFQTVP